MAELLINNREGNKGDVICVRPDGFEWSDSELPRVIKLDLSYEEAKVYEQPLTETKESIVDGKTQRVTTNIRKRKYQISSDVFINDKIDATQATAFDVANIIEKDIAVEKELILAENIAKEDS